MTDSILFAVKGSIIVIISLLIYKLIPKRKAVPVRIRVKEEKRRYK